MRRLLTLSLAALALTACAERINWYKADGNFNVDSYECLRDATALGPIVYVGFGVTQRQADPGIFNRCMVARGWTPSRG